MDDFEDRRVAKLRRALEWYANPDIYKPRANEKDNRDLSSHARATLEALGLSHGPVERNKAG